MLTRKKEGIPSHGPAQNLENMMLRKIVAKCQLLYDYLLLKLPSVVAQQLDPEEEDVVSIQQEVVNLIRTK